MTSNKFKSVSRSKKHHISPHETNENYQTPAWFKLFTDESDHCCSTDWSLRPDVVELWVIMATLCARSYASNATTRTYEKTELCKIGITWAGNYRWINPKVTINFLPYMIADFLSLELQNSPISGFTNTIVPQISLDLQCTLIPYIIRFLSLPWY